MSNPFHQPGRANGELRALCPLTYPQQATWFVDVDGAGTEFARFKEQAASGAFAGGSHAVVVQGGAGCGKTTLIQRCAAHLDAAPEPTRVTLDITSERRAGIGAAEQISRVTRRVFDAVSRGHGLIEAVVKELKERRDDPDDFFPLLSSVAKDIDKQFVVLLPYVETPEELRRSIAIARDGITVFIETALVLSEPELRAEAIAVSVLKLGALDRDDGWKFVDARMGNGSGAPAIEKDTVDKFMEERMRARGLTTIRELEKACAGVFDTALEQAKAKIEFDDFLYYYFRAGELT